MALDPELTLSDGTTIPQLGIGVFQMTDEQAEAAVAAAAQAGYRLVDTAQGYANEAAVGRALARLDAPLYVTTKLRNDLQGYDSTLRAFDESVARLGVEVLDLFLIHWPAPARDLYVETWRAFVRLKEEGRVRSIGVSNFEPQHLERLVAETGVAPVVNQVELHPYFQQADVRAADAALGVVTEAWGPLGQAKTGLLSDEVVVRIARERDATPAQVVLAWHLAIGNVAIPKSVTPARIVENFGAVRVELDPADLADLAALDTGVRIGASPFDVN